MRSSVHFLLRMRSTFHHWWKDIFSPCVYDSRLKSWLFRKISFQWTFHFVSEFGFRKTAIPIFLAKRTAHAQFSPFSTVRSSFHQWWKDIFSPHIYEFRLKTWLFRKISFQPSFHFVSEFGFRLLLYLRISGYIKPKIQRRQSFVDLRIPHLCFASIVIKARFKRGVLREGSPVLSTPPTLIHNNPAHS